MTTEARFIVTGDFITRLSRDLFIEGKLRDAERILMQCIEGMSYENAVSIIKGESRIAGTSATTLTLEKDDDQKIKNFIKSKYSGVVRYKDSYYVPYAVVNGWGPKDVGAGHIHKHKLYDNYAPEDPVPVGLTSRFRMMAESRNVAYMDDKQNDLQFILKLNNINSVILWKSVPIPPYWIDVINKGDWQQGLDEFIEVGNELSVRNHQSYFEYDEYDDRHMNDDDEFEEVESKNVDDIENDALKDLMVNAGIDESAITGMLKIFSNDVDDSVPVALSNEQLQKAMHGYILKDGRFFGCEYHHHANLAGRIFKHLFNREVEDPEKEADNAGWIRIQKSGISGTHNCIICSKPTKK